MEQFWLSLELIEKVYLLSAISGSVAFIVSVVMKLLGADFDVPGDGSIGSATESIGPFDSDVSFQILSWMGLASFFTMFGFVALALSKANSLEFVFSFSGGILAGIAHFLFIRFLFKSFQRLQSTGKKS